MEMENICYGAYAQPSYKKAVTPMARPRRDRFVDGYCSARSAWKSVGEATTVSMKAKVTERNGLVRKYDYW